MRGKHVVVLGGSSGIGLEVARQALERGAVLTITGRNADRLAQAKADLAKADLGGDTETSAFDALDRAATADFFAKVRPVDHLVSCIGDTQWGTFLTLDEKKARGILEAKFWTQLHIVKSVLPKLAADGTITLTGGTSPDRGAFPYLTAGFSAAGNHLLEALVEGLSIEISPRRINVVEPGLTDTPLWDSLPAEDRERAYATIARQSQIKRIPSASEVARSYIHAIESGVINGDRLRPGGGPMIDASMFQAI